MLQSLREIKKLIGDKELRDFAEEVKEQTGFRPDNWKQIVEDAIEEYKLALEKREEEEGEAHYEEDQGYEDPYKDEVKEEGYETEDDTEKH